MEPFSEYVKENLLRDLDVFFGDWDITTICRDIVTDVPTYYTIELRIYNKSTAKSQYKTSKIECSGIRDKPITKKSRKKKKNNDSVLLRIEIPPVKNFPTKAVVDFIQKIRGTYARCIRAIILANKLGLNWSISKELLELDQFSSLSQYSNLIVF